MVPSPGKPLTPVQKLAFPHPPAIYGGTPPDPISVFIPLRIMLYIFTLGCLVWTDDWRQDLNPHEPPTTPEDHKAETSRQLSTDHLTS